MLLDLEKERKEIARFDEEIATREEELGKKVRNKTAHRTLAYSFTRIYSSAVQKGLLAQTRRVIKAEEMCALSLVIPRSRPPPIKHAEGPGLCT